MPDNLADLSSSEADQLARDLAERHRSLAAAAAVGRVGVARAEALSAATGTPADPGGAVARLPSAPLRERWGWRRAVRFARERRMYTPEYLRLYARFLSHRLRHPHVDLQGMVFLGRRVELTARRHHGRLQLGPWCWIGNDNKLRAHEGNLRLGPKVVMGRDNV
ncbi:MAG: hypothetical protein GEU81_16145, partial [Nitriliruptorales bacterium]|nr:hypothetical protein [Nitriliruptorales bacterium]